MSSAKTAVFVTTPADLQDTIDNTIKPNAKYGPLWLLFGPGITSTTFDVPGNIPELQVHRFAPDGVRKRFEIAGSSTYHNVRLDKWEAHTHKRHVLKLGHPMGVIIKLEGLMDIRSWCMASRSPDEDKQADLEENFERVRRHKGDWDEVRKPVAAIFGLLLGTTKFIAGLKLTAGGFYAKYAFGMHAAEIGMGGVKLTAVATAAGPAVVLGVAAAAAVYFIPWTDLFSWLKNAVSWMWDKVKDIWDTFICWLKRLFGFEQGGKGGSFSGHGQVPRSF